MQDTSTYDSQQKNISGQITVGVGWGSASGSASKSNIDADYASVNEQSGIIAGDKGYDVSVVNDTNLIGGIITSTQKAEDDNLNSFSTGTLAINEIENYANASVDSAGYSLSTNDLGSKYTIAKAIGRNLMDSADESEPHTSTTYSTINTDNIRITNNEAQLSLTGKSAEETISSINNDTTNANTALEQIDYEALVDDIEIQRRFNNNVSEVAIQFSDEGYRTMFLREHPVVQILTDENGKILIDDDGKPQTRVLTPEEAKNLQAGSDGKINIVANGIFNDEEAAAKYAVQHSNNDGPIYAIVFPEADNAVSELMIAGYQKFLENEYTGLTNSTIQVVNYMTTYGESGLDVNAHSRGSLTVGSAIEYLAANGQNVLDATSINLFGPAYNAQDMANLLYTTSDGTQKGVTLQNHTDDFVGGMIGGNPSTGGETPPNSSTIEEWYKMFINPATAHSCYGNGGDKGQCEKYWGTNWQNPDPKTMIINATNGGVQ
ncbi:hypothetical protein [Sulfurovum sp.]|uniref:hypothetical protein n=1 Tax=Sulfurovum sp. TaxID=1969726 RepID=UPI002A36D8A0|nr:hypothetical protein [Sulfurovum sp.]MDY0403323.1 hypothetical protein [Sulfurovum sp.]